MEEKELKGTDNIYNIINRDPTILGQTVKYSAYNSKIPLIIVKKFYERNPGYNYLVCLDGSKKSYKAIEHTLKLIQDNNKDTIMLCFAPTPDRVKLGESIKEKVKEMLENQNVKWDYEQLNVNMDFGEEIIKFINYNEKVRIDFVVFGSNGERAELSNMSFFGSTSNQILIKALANPIIIP